MVARSFEEQGLTTTGLVLIEEHAQRVKPPRMLAVPFYFGNTLGEADNPELQHKVLQSAFDLLNSDQGPVLEHYPEEKIPDVMIQGSEAAKTPYDNGVNSPEISPADELTGLRAYYEQWSSSKNGRTAVGITGIPQRRFRGIVRFIENYIGGENPDMKERSADIAVPQFVRYCVDDLKAFYYEARMAQRPDGSDVDIHTWFWSDTAMGKLVMSLAEYMRNHPDPSVNTVAYGIAR